MSKPNDTIVGRRHFLKTSATVAIVGFINYDCRAESGSKLPFEFLDEPAVHNMLIVGQETVFLSHLPMFRAPDFDSPHRYQVILEVAFTKEGSDPTTVYANDRKKNPATKIYTLNPDEFVLPNLIPTNAHASISSFRANIFRGHLEKPGKKLLISGVEAGVRKIIHFRELDPKTTNPPQLEYILFGKRKELFLAHFITRPPDFDQVLSVSVSDHSFTDQELANGMHVIFERPNSISRRFSEKQEAVGEVRGGNEMAKPLKVTLKVGSELYFEEGELRVPAVFEQTAAERKAGFP